MQAAQSLELSVLAEVVYVARLAPQWARRPYWLLRRCVVPYVAARQFLVLRRDNVPVAYAGWAMERAGEPWPWRTDRYLPARGEIGGDGRCCVTEIIAPLHAPERVLQEVAKWLRLQAMPAWIEYDEERRIVAVHEA